MLTKVDISNDSGDTIELVLQDISNGFLVKDIQGLDPVPASIVSSSFANLDGEQFQSSKRQKRNIIFRLGLEPDYANQSVRGLRNRLYDVIQPKARVHMRFTQSGAPALMISGRVETFDAAIFTQSPEATISIICMDPDFREEDGVVITGYTGLTPELNVENFEYNGTVSSGIDFSIEIPGSVSGFTIHHNHGIPGVTASSLAFSESLTTGDVVRIVTTPGNKLATITRSGVLSSIMRGVSPYSDWISLVRGDNKISVTMDTFEAEYTLSFLPKYGGV